MSIVKYIPTEPPIIDVRNRELSFILHLTFFARLLSETVRNTANKFINIIYISKIILKIILFTKRKDDILKLRNFIPVLLCVVLLFVTIGFSSSKKEDEKQVLSFEATNDTAQNNTSTNDSAKIEPKVLKSDEMRAVWVSYFELSMQNSSDKSEKAFTEKFSKIADNCIGVGFNTLIVQVRPFGDALYNSKYFPWSHVLTGTQGKNPGYDPLKIMCDICKKKGLKIHAWVNPYRIINSDSDINLSDDNPYKKDSSMGLKTKSGIYYDPSNENVIELIKNGIKEIVENYDIDGIQFDDYFYPPDIGNADNNSYEKYKAKNGNQCMSLDNWRLANVNMLVCKVYQTVHNTKDNVVFGISPQGNLENNEKIYADIKSWCNCKGFVDYICPQIYFSPDNPSLGFEDCFNQWSNLTYDKSVKFYVGLAGYKAGTDDDDNTWKSSDNILADEYNIVKNSKKAEGIMLYSYNSIISEESRKEIQNLKYELY